MAWLLLFKLTSENISLPRQSSLENGDGHCRQATILKGRTQPQAGLSKGVANSTRWTMFSLVQGSESGGHRVEYRNIKIRPLERQ
jgi:hypothetical protein